MWHLVHIYITGLLPFSVPWPSHNACCFPSGSLVWRVSWRRTAVSHGCWTSTHLSGLNSSAQEWFCFCISLLRARHGDGSTEWVAPYWCCPFVWPLAKVRGQPMFCMSCKSFFCEYRNNGFDFVIDSFESVHQLCWVFRCMWMVPFVECTCTMLSIFVWSVCFSCCVQCLCPVLRQVREFEVNQQPKATRRRRTSRNQSVSSERQVLGSAEAEEVWWNYSMPSTLVNCGMQCLPLLSPTLQSPPLSLSVCLHVSCCKCKPFCLILVASVCS